MKSIDINKEINQLKTQVSLRQRKFKINELNKIVEVDQGAKVGVGARVKVRGEINVEEAEEDRGIGKEMDLIIVQSDDPDPQKNQKTKVATLLQANKAAQKPNQTQRKNNLKGHKDLNHHHSHTVMEEVVKYSQSYSKKTKH